jgi:hypothetical protein
MTTEYVFERNLLQLRRALAGDVLLEHHAGILDDARFRADTLRQRIANDLEVCGPVSHYDEENKKDWRVALHLGWAWWPQDSRLASFASARRSPIAWERVVDEAIAEISPQVRNLLYQALERRLPWTWVPA